MWSPLGFHTATYLLKLFLEQTISTKLCDLLHMFCWFVCTKTKVTNITSEWQSSYNQNNFIILMKFNRNNVGIEENFQVSSFTAFRPRLNNLMSTNMCDTTVIIQSVCPFPCHEITRDDPTSSLFEIYKSFLAHLAKGNVSFCHHLAFIIRRLSFVNFPHFNLLLWNPSAKWTETW